MKNRLIYLLTVMLTSATVFAQNGELQISGKITSDDGEMPGVNVLIKGTTTGTVTDIEGNFNLSVPNAETVLIFSFIGYSTQEVLVGSQSTIDVFLATDMEQLDEVVVIGYGVQKKKVVSAAIESVSAEEISSTPILRVEQALQGRTPGVQVTNLSGQPGEAPTVRIRGTGTTGNATPIYVVDGLIVDGIDYLNPGDIESMDVLKGASAAIYGTQSANGVVLITTKSGEKGKMSITYSSYYAIQNAARTIDMLNADQYKSLMNEGAANANLTEPFDLNEISLYDTDWQDALIQKNAPMVSHQLSITGGSEKSSYASSLSYFSQQGIIGGEKSQFDRFTARLNTTHKVNKMLNFGNNLAYTHTVSRGIASNASFNGAYSSALNMDPLTPLYETDENILGASPYSDEPVVVSDNGQMYGVSNYVGAEVVNPLALLEIDNSETRVDKLVGNVYGEFMPIDGLKVRSSLGIDLAYVLNDDFKPLYYLNGAQLNDNKTSVNKEIERNFTWQWDNTATYTKQIGDHNMSALLGLSAREYKYEDLSGFNADVPTSDPDNVYLNLATDTAWTASGGAARSSLYSQFGRLSYDYKEKYSFTGIARRDGSSRFGSNNRFGLFYSLSGAWVLSDESFMQNLGSVNFIKLRASWGVNGNQKIGDHRFISTIDKGRGYTFANGRVVGSSPSYLENADIQWEEAHQFGVGLDVRAFSDRMTFTADYYQKETKKLLETAGIPGHVGIDAPVANVGSIKNSGIELGMTWRSSAGDLNYSVGANAAYNKNQITNIANDFLAGASWAIAGQVTRNEEGLPIAYFWGYETNGLFQNDGDVFRHINGEGDLLQPDAVPGDVRFVDVNNDGVINAEDRSMIGNPTPDWTLGFDASMDYKGFDFSILFIGALGNDIFNGTQRQDLRYTNRPTDILDRWTGEGTSNSEPRFTWVDTNNNYRVSDLYIEDGSYVKLKNIQLGYNIPSAILDRIGATNWRVYVSAENLITITGYGGLDPEIGVAYDPEVSGSAFDVGIDRAIYPQARTFRVGTSLTF